MNACAFCRHGKRKCDKARPSCSNCIRLRRHCVYTEDAIQSQLQGPLPPSSGQAPDEGLRPKLVEFLASSGRFGQGTPKQSIIATTMQIIGSPDNMRTISNDFFTGTHQRISTISKIRFHQSLPSLTSDPSADFATLCLAVLLIQEMPTGKVTVMQSPLYAMVKSFISILEASNDISIDLAHCRVLVTFYEMGHGLHTAAYVSIAGSARLARALGLHRKPWRSVNVDSGKTILEEMKRIWWAIGNMDRFINLCLGDAYFATDDSTRRDPLPIEDLLWSELSDIVELDAVISSTPSLDTPFDTRVGQMARECQISHLAGRVVRHVFDPLPDQDFNIEEGLQLERTPRAYLPLLANEELEIGKYCGAFGVCNSALFVLYEFMLSHCHGDSVERDRIVHSIEEISIRATIFAEATHNDRAENYPIETQSPYLIYSLYQAAVVQHGLWKQRHDPQCKRNLDSLKDILHAFTKRWMITWQYLDILENLDERWSPITLPFQGTFISSGRPNFTS